MPTEDGFTSDHSLSRFPSGHADEHEERGSLLLLNAAILLLVASLIGMATVLSFGNPAKVFADIKASLTDMPFCMMPMAKPPSSIDQSPKSKPRSLPSVKRSIA